MPCAAQTHKSLHASLLAAKSALSAGLPTPLGRCYRRQRCRVSVSAIGAVEKAQAQAKQRPEYIPGRIDDPSYVRIFDTTLRDGEQSPGMCTKTMHIMLVRFHNSLGVPHAGATLTSKEKLDIARQLSKLGVDIIEAGFPVASPDDFEAVRSIALDVGNAVDADGYVPVICGLSRWVYFLMQSVPPAYMPWDTVVLMSWPLLVIIAFCRTKQRDLDAAWDAVKHAKRPRVHVFIATSPIHMQYKLKMTPDQVVDNAVKAVQYLKSRGCHDIEFSPEDASRSEPDFLYRVLSEVIQAGATTLNIPDTTGWALPHEFANLISKIKAETPGAENVVISTHCQNDLGLATANSLAGAAAGARQLECTINGIGERAGNASLEEIVMAIDLRGYSFAHTELDCFCLWCQDSQRQPLWSMCARCKSISCAALA